MVRVCCYLSTILFALTLSTWCFASFSRSSTYDIIVRGKRYQISQSSESIKISREQPILDDLRENIWWEKQVGRQLIMMQRNDNDKSIVVPDLENDVLPVPNVKTDHVFTYRVNPRIVCVISGDIALMFAVWEWFRRKAKGAVRFEVLLEKKIQ